MQTQIEEKELGKVLVTYVADPEIVLNKRKEATEQIFKLASKGNFPGFRKGKAPLSAVKLKYSKKIEEQTQQSLLQQAEQDILFETKIKTLFGTQVLSAQLLDSRFDCQLLFFKKPSVELKQYKDFEIPKPHAPKTQAELTEQILQDLRMKHGEISPYGENDFIQNGDKVTLDVKCVKNKLNTLSSNDYDQVRGKPIIGITLDDVNFFDTKEVIEELTKEGFFYTVGKGFYCEFDDNIQGMTPGETRVFDVLWDTTTQERATFTVKMHMGGKIIPASLDDAFAAKLNFENFDKLKEQISGLAAQNIEEFEKNTINEQIVNRLLFNHEVELWDWLIYMDAKQLAAQHKFSWETLSQEQQNQFNEKAKKRLKLTFILETIRDNEPELQFSNNEIMNIVRNIVADKLTQQGQKINDKFLDQQLVEMSKKGELATILAAIQQNLTMEWLTKHCIIKE